MYNRDMDKESTATVHSGNEEDVMVKTSLDGGNVNPQLADELSNQIKHGMLSDNRNFLYPKDIRNLQRNKYEEVSKRFEKSYVIKNKKTKQIVELKAASSVHAANLIGWRPRHIELIETIDNPE